MNTKTLGTPDLRRPPAIRDRKTDQDKDNLNAPIPPFEKASGVPADSSAVEREISALEEQILRSWKLRLNTKKASTDARSNLAETTRKLERDLASYKEILAKNGRGGKWSEFLREVGLPKATADRYVVRFNQREHTKEIGKLLTEELSEEQLKVLAKRCLQSLRKRLKTREQAHTLLSLLSAELQDLHLPPSAEFAEAVTTSAGKEPTSDTVRGPVRIPPIPYLD